MSGNFGSAPVFAPLSAAESETGAGVNLDEIFEDCFAASEWAMLNETLSAEAKEANGVEGAVTSLGSASAETSGGSMPLASAGATRFKSRTKFTSLRDDDGDDEDDAVGEKGGAPRKRRRPAEPKSMTDQQRVERRERNREHAKRSRIRKKFLLESLLEQVSDLRDENKCLRQAIRDHLPDEAQDVLQDCITEESLLLCTDDGRRSAAGLPATQQLMEPDFRLMMALQSAQQNFAVSDPSLPDNPIVYASQGFLQLTGYSMSQVIGRNCRFLQGPATDPRAVDRIRDGVAQGVDTSVCLLNYKADGTPFWNQFFVAALRDADGSIVNYVGVQCEVNEVPIEEIKERAKRMALLDI